MKKTVYNLAEIEKKLYMNNVPQKMFVFTVQQEDDRIFLDRRLCASKSNDVETDYFCKVLEGCGF